MFAVVRFRIHHQSDQCEKARDEEVCYGNFDLVPVRPRSAPGVLRNAVRFSEVVFLENFGIGFAVCRGAMEEVFGFFGGFVRFLSELRRVVGN